MRCFIALALPERVGRGLDELEAGLRQRLRGLRWTGPGSHHITLAFLGDVNQAGVDCAFHAARALACLRPLDCRFRGLAGFPSRGPYSVLTLALADEAGYGSADSGKGRLHRAWERLNQALRAAELRHGIEPLNEDYSGGKPFHPHVTLARSREEPLARSRWEALAPLADGLVGEAFRIDECAVFESVLSPAGPSYRVLESVKLAGTED